NPQDYDRWHSQGARGWSYLDVLPYFRRMERRAEGATPYRGDQGPVGVRRQQQLHPLNEVFLGAGRPPGYPLTADGNGQEQEGFCRFDMNVDHGFRSSSYYAYVEQQPRRANLDVRSGVTAHRVLFEDERAVAVEFEQGGERFQFRAEREIILCAGAIGS